ncbi:MAG: ATP-binding protein [Lentisphaerota bacterium]
MAHADKGPVVIRKTILKIPCRYRELGLVRESVVEQAARASLTEDQIAQVEMAVDEACTNIIEHSYGGESAASQIHKTGIVIHLIQFTDRFVVDIFDHGTGFDFSTQTPISPDDWTKSQMERGLGLHIITSFVDDYCYERGTRDGNYLRLTKRI